MCKLLVLLLILPALSFSQPANIMEFYSAIENASIIGYGEQSHGFESHNQTKLLVLQKLRQHNEPVLFESSFVLATIAYLDDSLSTDRLKKFIYPFWNTGSLREAITHIQDSEVKYKAPLVLGFDIQEDCRFKAFSQYLVKNRIVVHNIDKLLYCDSILEKYIGIKPVYKGPLTESELMVLHDSYDQINKEIALLPAGDRRTLLLQSIVNRKELCKYLTERPYSIQLRDSLMAKNIIFIKENIYPDTRIHIWAANSHVARYERKQLPKPMGYWLARYYNDKYFSIGYFNGIKPGMSQKNFAPMLSVEISHADDPMYDAKFWSGKNIKIRKEEWYTPCY